MACALTTGFSLGCKTQMGGIRNLYIATYGAVTGSGISIDATTGEVQDLPSDITLYRYEVDDNATSYNEPYTAEENLAGYYSPEIVTRLLGITYTKRNEIVKLAQNRLVCFVEFSFSAETDKKLLCVGLNRGLQLTAGGFEHGAGRGDFSGMNLTLSGQQAEPSRLVEAYTEYPFDNAAFSLTVSPAVVPGEYTTAVTES